MIFDNILILFYSFVICEKKCFKFICNLVIDNCELNKFKILFFGNCIKVIFNKYILCKNFYFCISSDKIFFGFLCFIN